MNCSQAIKHLFILSVPLMISGCGIRVAIEPVIDIPSITEESTPNVALFRYDPQSVTLRFEHNAAAPQYVSEWAKEIEGEWLVANGAYFLENDEPAGLFVSDSTLVSERRFDGALSGLLILEPEFHIVDTATEPMPPLGDLIEAAQSYPFLIKDGAPVVEQDSGLLARRTFIGTDKNGGIYFGIVDREAMTLHELSRELAAMDVAWDDVLNLDGGTSSGIITSEASDRDIDSLLPVPNVIVVSPR